MTRAQSVSKSSAKSRCSTLMNSCRRRSASLAASPNAISTSGLTLMRRSFDASLRLGRYFERHLVLFGVLGNLQGFRFGDVAAEHSGHSEALVMHTQHDVRGLGDG